MATPEAQEAAARERIIRHMNADHQDSVRRYVEQHFNASSYAAGDAKLVDINSQAMKITYSNKTVTLPFDPPMKSLREARERVVQMDKDAIMTLKRHPVTLKKYMPPRGGHLFNFTMCLTLFAAFSRKANLAPGSLLYENVLGYAPGFAAFCLRMQPLVIWTMVVFHTVETAVMTRKLARHSVVTFSGLWWAWVLSTYVEGGTAFWRIDKFVKKSEQGPKEH